MNESPVQLEVEDVGPDFPDGPDEDGFQGPRPWNGFNKQAEPNDQVRFDWINERERWAGIHIDFGRDGYYRRHRVTWHQDGWWQAEGQTMREAIDNAMKKSAEFEQSGKRDG